MSLFSSINISASGLSAQRKRMNAISSNIANIDVTRTQEGGPYRKRTVVMKERKSTPLFRSLIRRGSSNLSVTHKNHISSPRKEILSQGDALPGVEAQEVIQANLPPRLVYDPDHPDADESGYVALPDINIVTEMVDMITATRAYEANVTAVNAAKQMARKALEI